MENVPTKLNEKKDGEEVMWTQKWSSKQPGSITDSWISKKGEEESLVDVRPGYGGVVFSAFPRSSKRRMQASKFATRKEALKHAREFMKKHPGGW
jgi:hypothetical protein